MFFVPYCVTRRQAEIRQATQVAVMKLKVRVWSVAGKVAIACSHA
jgi:hypothetical protein